MIEGRLHFNCDGGKTGLIPAASLQNLKLKFIHMKMSLIFTLFPSASSLRGANYMKASAKSCITVKYIIYKCFNEAAAVNCLRISPLSG